MDTASQFPIHEHFAPLVDMMTGI